jgi:hypothetical protein
MSIQTKLLPVVTCRTVLNSLEGRGYETRAIGIKDGQRWFVVHVRDPVTNARYNPRSYFSGEGLVALFSSQSKQEMRDAIVAAQQTKVNYIHMQKEPDMSKKTGAAAEKAAREARQSKSTTKGAAAPPVKSAKGKTTTTKKESAKATAKKNGKVKSNVDLSDPDVKLLASYQEQSTTERLTANNMVKLFKRIKAATYDKPVVHSTLNAYDSRQARELTRLGLISKENIPDVGLAYFGAKK